jgi:hypothetical protein
VILDADDVYLPERLQALAELANARPDLDILTTDAYLVVDGRRVRRNYDRRWRFEVADQRRAILQRNFIFGHAAVRRERLLAHGGFDESILWTTDWDLWLRLILDGSLAGAVTEPLALYRIRQSSLTARRRDLLIGKLTTLDKASRNDAVRSEERAVLALSLAAYRRELELLELREALISGDALPRSRAFRVLVGSGYSAKNRFEAAGMFLVPRVVARLLRRRAARSWVGAGGVRVSRRSGPGLLGRLARRR